MRVEVHTPLSDYFEGSSRCVPRHVQLEFVDSCNGGATHGEPRQIHARVELRRVGGKGGWVCVCRRARARSYTLTRACNGRVVKKKSVKSHRHTRTFMLTTTVRSHLTRSFPALSAPLPQALAPMLLSLVVFLCFGAVIWRLRSVAEGQLCVLWRTLVVYSKVANELSGALRKAFRFAGNLNNL